MFANWCGLDRWIKKCYLHISLHRFRIKKNRLRVNNYELFIFVFLANRKKFFYILANYFILWYRAKLFSVNKNVQFVCRNYFWPVFLLAKTFVTSIGRWRKWRKFSFTRSFNHVILIIGWSLELSFEKL